MPSNTSERTKLTEADVVDRTLSAALDRSFRDLDDSTALADAGVDSLALAELVIRLEQQGFGITDEAVAAARTLGDLRAWAHESPERSSVELVAVSPVDADELWRWHTSGTHLTRYRARGRSLGAAELERLLFGDALAQCIVRDAQGPAGLVSAIGADLRNRHAHLTVVAAPERSGSGVVLRGLLAFCDWLFAQFDLRKLYAEVLEPNYAAFASGEGRWFELEGVLRGHEYVDGQWVDCRILAIERGRLQASVSAIRFPASSM